MRSLSSTQSFVGQIPFSAEGLVDLWDNAWAATQRAMGYSVVALSQTRNVDTFLQVVQPQAVLTRLIGGEVNELVGNDMREGREYNRGLLPRERRIMMRWHHDRYATQASVLYSIAELAKHMPNLDASWYERACRTYAYNRSLSNIVYGAIEAQMPLLRIRDIAIDVDVNGDDIYFVNRRVRQLATDIITNLISNAVKYSLNGGTIRVLFKDRTFSVEDEGIGMNMPFANLLGQTDPMREDRAEGVQGFGFGWTTIGRALDKLGWRRSIDTEPNVGSKFTVTMLENHLVSHRGATPARIDGTKLFEVFVQGGDVFNGAKPFADYHIVSDDLLDVSSSPAAWMINAVADIDAQYAI